MATQPTPDTVLMTNILSPIGGQTDGVGVIRNAPTTKNGTRAHDGLAALSNGNVVSVLDRPLLVEVFEDFLGGRAIPINGTGDADSGPWFIKDTSAAGTPTYVVGDDSKDGQLAVAFDNTNEVQVVTLSFNNVNNINVDQEPVFICRVSLDQTLNANTTLVMGFAADQNNTLNSITRNAWCRLSGSMALTMESYDGTTRKGASAPDTAVTLAASTFYEFKVSMSAADGASPTNVKYFYRSTLGGDWTALTIGGTTFSTGTNIDVQPFIQWQKAANAETDAFHIDYVYAYWKRAA